MRHEEICCDKTYNDDDVLTSEEWTVDGFWHRTDGPADQKWHDNGIRTLEEWCFKSKRHRTDGPALRIWSKYGDLKYEAWYLHGQLHRADGPAERKWENDDEEYEDSYYPDQTYLEQERWHLHGKLHRTDGPAETEWCKSGLDNIISQDWYLYGKKHRIDGPASVLCYGGERFETWSVHGNIHRWDGPATQYWRGPGWEDCRIGSHGDDWWSDKLKESHYYFDGDLVTQVQHRRRRVLKTGREKVLRAARLLSLVLIVPHLPHDILSVVGGYLCSQSGRPAGRLPRA